MLTTFQILVKLEHADAHSNTVSKPWCVSVPVENAGMEQGVSKTRGEMERQLR